MPIRAFQVELSIGIFQEKQRVGGNVESNTLMYDFREGGGSYPKGIEKIVIQLIKIENKTNDQTKNALIVI